MVRGPLKHVGQPLTGRSRLGDPDWRRPGDLAVLLDDSDVVVVLTRPWVVVDKSEADFAVQVLPVVKEGLILDDVDLADSRGPDNLHPQFEVDMIFVIM